MSFLTRRNHTPLTVCQEDVSPPFTTTLDSRKTKADASSVLRRSPDPLFYAPSASFFSQTLKTLKESRVDWMSKLQASQMSSEDEEFTDLLDRLTEEGQMSLEEKYNLISSKEKLLCLVILEVKYSSTYMASPHCGHPNLTPSNKALESSDYWWPGSQRRPSESLRKLSFMSEESPSP
ncbi:hypothetical protein GEMRC1_005337 [Eukaryota sp. GEM-RC1]